MLYVMDGLPDGVEGVRAEGIVTKDDYEAALEPLLATAREENERVRLLFELGPDFEKFTAAAAWKDLKLGLAYLKELERCAVVSDHRWVRAGSRLAGAMVPCEVRTFERSLRPDAIDWLESDTAGEPVSIRVLPETHTAVIEPTGAVTEIELEKMSDIIDAWIEGDGALKGLVLFTPEADGLEPLGEALRSEELLGEHAAMLERIAVVAEADGPAWMHTLGDLFPEAHVQRFAPAQLAEATAWAGGPDGVFEEQAELEVAAV